MKKQILTIGTLAATIAPIAAVVSCGDDSTNPNAVFATNVVVAANKEWVGEYTKIADEFNKAHPNNAYKILIKEQHDSDIKWRDKGITDPSIPDVFTVDNRDATEMYHQHYLAQFPGLTNQTSFEHKYFNDQNHFINWNITSKVNMNNKVFAVPFNREAQLAVQYDGAAIPTNTFGPSVTDNTKFNIAAPQELFKVAGIGQKGQNDTNHAESNLFQLIKGSQNATTHKYTYTSNLNVNVTDPAASPADEASLSLKKIYDRVVKPLHDASTHLGAANSEASKAYEGLYSSDFMTFIKAQEALFLNAIKSGTDLNSYLNKSNLSPRLFLGTWRINDLIKQVQDAGLDKTKLHFYAPADYHQWAGGWVSVMNKRVTGEKAKIASDFIGELLKPSHANALYKVTSKPSPLDGITWNTGDANLNDTISLIEKASTIAVPRDAVNTVADKAAFDYWGVPIHKAANASTWNIWASAIKQQLDAKVALLNG